MTELDLVLKEWAVLCLALAEGRQIILLRKGGIADPEGAFDVAHRRFWLLPTYVHQQQEGIVPEYLPLLEQVRQQRPPQGILHLHLFAELVAVHHLSTLDQAQSLAGLHGLSQETVQARFHYRQPGLFVLALRVFRLPAPLELPEPAHLAGCKSWAALGRKVIVDGAFPVLSDEAFTARWRPLEERFNGPRNPRG